jgi:hypothetical protein
MIKQCVYTLVFLLSLLVICFAAYVVVVFLRANNCHLPVMFGNFENVRKQLNDSSREPEFSFAVIGDTKGCGTFEEIFEKLKDQPISFLVMLGDIVRKPTEGYHLYFRSLINEISPPSLFSVSRVITMLTRIHFLSADSISVTAHPDSLSDTAIIFSSSCQH